MEIELNDLKSRIDSDVIESRALEEQASAIPQLEVLYLAPSTFCRLKNRTHLSTHTQCKGVRNLEMKPCIGMRGHNGACRQSAASIEPFSSWHRSSWRIRCRRRRIGKTDMMP